MELRILLLLSCATKEWLTQDEIFVYDFIVSYGKEFEVCDKNLHGDSSFKFGEVSLRNSIINEAVKDLVVRNLIVVEADKTKGFFFKISNSGLSYICSFEDDYTEEYKRIAALAFSKYKNSSENELLNMIHDKAMGKRR